MIFHSRSERAIVSAWKSLTSHGFAVLDGHDGERKAEAVITEEPLTAKVAKKGRKVRQDAILNLADKLV